MKLCKYYTKRVGTLQALISCLYTMHDEEFCTGGLLHIITDDGNLRDSDIKWCLEECIKHPEREDAVLGKFICNELLQLSMEQRRLVYNPSWTYEWHCDKHERCDRCPICMED